MQNKKKTRKILPMMLAAVAAAGMCANAEDWGAALAGNVGTYGFAATDTGVNIRNKPGTDGDVVGVLMNDAIVYIEDVDEYGWYKVTSGGVEGYVSSEFIVTGADADEKMHSAGYLVAAVEADGTNVRDSAGYDSEIIMTADSGEKYGIIDETDEWVMVAINEYESGYVSKECATVMTDYNTAVPVTTGMEMPGEPVQYMEPEEPVQWLYPEDGGSWDGGYEEDGSSQETWADDGAYYEEPIYDAWDDSGYEPQETYSEADTYGYGESYDYGYTDGYVDEGYGYSEPAYNDVADDYGYSEYDGTVDDYSYSETTDTEDYGYDYGYSYDAADDSGYGYDDTSSGYIDASGYSSVGGDAASYACQFVGNPYVWGGTSLTGGADCSGFVQSVYANYGVYLPRTAAEQSYSGYEVDMGSLQAGDLLFYSHGGGIDHVAIYLGGGSIVHASSSTTGIIISNYDYSTPVCARRVA